MFLPIGSNLPYFRIPIATISWLFLSCFIYWFVTRGDLSLLQHSDVANIRTTLTYQWAIVPAAHNPYWKFFTYQFVHGSVSHLLANMWYFIIFGWILENALGWPVFLLLTLFGGAVAILPELVVQSNQNLPIIGASGAIAFIMGVVALMFPRAKIRLLFLFLPIKNSPASFFIPLRYLVYFWLLMQASGLAFSLWVSPRPIAYATHINGFFLGSVVGLVLYFVRRRKEKFIDIDLSGKDLKRFYYGMKAYQEKEFGRANEILQELSDANPWMVNLQVQLLQQALQQDQKFLAQHIWNNALPPLLAFKRTKDVKRAVENYKQRFGELPELAVQQRIKLSQLLGFNKLMDDQLVSQGVSSAKV